MITLSRIPLYGSLLAVAACGQVAFSLGFESGPQLLVLATPAP